MAKGSFRDRIAKALVERYRRRLTPKQRNKQEHLSRAIRDTVKEAFSRWPRVLAHAGFLDRGLLSLPGGLSLAEEVVGWRLNDWIQSHPNDCMPPSLAADNRLRATIRDALKRLEITPTSANVEEAAQIVAAEKGSWIAYRTMPDGGIGFRDLEMTELLKPHLAELRPLEEVSLDALAGKAEALIPNDEAEELEHKSQCERRTFEEVCKVEKDRAALDVIREWIEVRDSETLDAVATRRGLLPAKAWRCWERIKRRSRRALA